jgi:hypothetical protein
MNKFMREMNGDYQKMGTKEEEILNKIQMLKPTA